VLRTLVDALVEPAVLVRAGTAEIEIINHAAAELFGYTPQDLIGQPIEVLMPERFRTAHLVYGRSQVGARTRRMAEHRQLTALRRDGTEFPVEITLSPMRTSTGEFVAAIVRDVTSAHATVGALERSEERYRNVVSAMSEGILILSADGSMEPCNETARLILDPASGATDGRVPSLPSDWKLLNEDGSPLAGDAWPGPLAIQQGVSSSNKVIGLVRPDHPLVWYTVSAQPLIEPNAAPPRAAVVTFSDVTEKREVNAALRASEEYLRQRTVELERANSQLELAWEQLEEAHAETVILLAAAAEAHDHTTGKHLRSVRTITEALACELGYSDAQVVDLGLASVLHDIGKLRVPGHILTRASALRSEQWDVMKQHTIWGAEFLSSRDRFVLAAQIARSHHERWDGGGYPDGLKGGEIPEEAAIVTVADSFDAMISRRPYREPWPVERAIAEIEACAGTQFSPRIAEVLVRLYDQQRLPLPHRADPVSRAA
jgi:PAS domain S-box-containing protein